MTDKATNKKAVYLRLLGVLKPFWFLVFLSTLAALVYVTLNSLSIWLTATLLNNILSDFNELVQNHSRLELLETKSINDYLKLYTNELILQPTPLETLKTLCIAILVVFGLKNFFLYIKNISLFEINWWVSGIAN